MRRNSRPLAAFLVSALFLVTGLLASGCSLKSGSTVGLAGTSQVTISPFIKGYAPADGTASRSVSVGYGKTVGYLKATFTSAVSIPTTNPVVAEAAVAADLPQLAVADLPLGRWHLLVEATDVKNGKLIYKWEGSVFTNTLNARNIRVELTPADARFLETITINGGIAAAAVSASIKLYDGSVITTFGATTALAPSGVLSVNADKMVSPGTYDMVFTLYAKDSREIFQFLRPNVQLGPGDTSNLALPLFDNPGAPLASSYTLDAMPGTVKLSSTSLNMTDKKLELRLDPLVLPSDDDLKSLRVLVQTDDTVPFAELLPLIAWDGTASTLTIDAAPFLTLMEGLNINDARIAVCAVDLAGQRGPRSSAVPVR